MTAPSLFTTTEVAALLHVNESTVKRWTQKGILHCFRTPGGHRKYKKDDVEEFAGRYGYDASDHRPKAEESAFSAATAIPSDYAILTKHYSSLAAKFTEILLRGNEDESFEFLHLLHINRFSLAELCDNIAAQSLRQVGALWVERIVTIDEEHTATNCARGAISRLQMQAPPDGGNGMIAYCGCLGGEFHDIGILCVRNALRAEGWMTVFPGANLPLESFVQGVIRCKPQLVCVSSTTPKSKYQFRRDCAALHDAARHAGAKLIVGGSAAMQAGRLRLDADGAAGSIGEMLEWINANLPGT
ncbi:MAG TPA: helix-turn-helix domain-containing protein [Bacteroidota bacterium]|nr:helix-turn-helix domain-containing protein [Bacteroidota bacterium]